MSITQKKVFWTVGSLVMAGAGFICQVARHYYEKVADNKLVEKQIEVLEGEGGICLG